MVPLSACTKSFAHHFDHNVGPADVFNVQSSLSARSRHPYLPNVLFVKLFRVRSELLVEDNPVWYSIRQAQRVNAVGTEQPPA